jgi:hypothetical protein
MHACDDSSVMTEFMVDVAWVEATMHACDSIASFLTSITLDSATTLKAHDGYMSQRIVDEPRVKDRRVWRTVR